MKPGIRLSLVFIVLLVTSAYVRSEDFSGPAGREHPDTLIFGVTPWGSAKIIEKAYGPVVHYLGRQLGMRTAVRISGAYKEPGRSIMQGKTDIGFFAPNAYVETKEAFPGLKYLVTAQREGADGLIRDTYNGVIITLKLSPFKTLEDLKGRRFAFTDEASASGYIYPRLLLKKKGIDPDTWFSRVFMVKKHDMAVSVLVDNMVEGCATWDGNLETARRKYGDVFRVIGKTPSIPLDACAAGTHVPDSVCERIRDILLGIKPGSKIFASMKRAGFPYHGFSVRSDGFYDELRMLRDDSVKEQ